MFLELIPQLAASCCSVSAPVHTHCCANATVCQDLLERLDAFQSRTLEVCLINSVPGNQVDVHAGHVVLLQLLSQLKRLQLLLTMVMYWSSAVRNACMRRLRKASSQMRCVLA